MSLLKKLGEAVRKVGRAIDPTMAGSIGNKLVGAIPVVGKVAQAGLTAVGELNKSKPAPAPSPVPPPQPSPTPPPVVNTGGVGAKVAPATVSSSTKKDGKKWVVIAGVAGAATVLAFLLTGGKRRRR